MAAEPARTSESLEQRARNALRALFDEGVRVGFVGGRVIIGGRTYPLSDLLRARGFRWVPERKHWIATTKTELHELLPALAGLLAGIDEMRTRPFVARIDLARIMERP